MIPEECGTCRYFRRAQIGQPLGVCRARPPVPVMAGMVKHPVTGEAFPQVKTYWPEIPDSEWCGTYIRKPFGVADLEQMDAAEASGSA